MQQWRRPGSKDDTHSVCLLMFVFPRRLDQLSRFHRWVDLALLFKKGVGREITVLEVADNVFSNVQHSRNPVLKFCGRRTAGDLSQSTILRPELFPGGSVFAAERERYTATTLWCSMAKATVAVVSRHEVLRDLFVSVAPKKNNESKPMDQIFKSSSTKFAHLVAKTR